FVVEREGFGVRYQMEMAGEEFVLRVCGRREVEVALFDRQGGIVSRDTWVPDDVIEIAASVVPLLGRGTPFAGPSASPDTDMLDMLKPVTTELRRLPEQKDSEVRS
ncbi:MAG: hypothetical protein ACPG77_10500, partial [Nannocystaceae bacterium]